MKNNALFLTISFILYVCGIILTGGVPCFCFTFRQKERMVPLEDLIFYKV